MRGPPQSQRNAVRIWRAELDRLHRSGINPERSDRILDVDASVSWSSPSRTICPCLTHSRPQGLWILSRGRRMSAAEALRCQGVNVASYSWEMSARQAVAAAGNAMCVGVLVHLFDRLLDCYSSPLGQLYLENAGAVCVTPELSPTGSVPSVLGIDDAASPRVEPDLSVCPVWTMLGALGALVADPAGVLGNTCRLPPGPLMGGSSTSIPCHSRGISTTLGLRVLLLRMPARHWRTAVRLTRF